MSITNHSKENSDPIVAEVNMKYLRARAFCEVCSVLVISLTLTATSLALGIFALLVGLCAVWFFFHVRRMDKYTIDECELRTKKLFSDQVDLSTSISRVQSVSVHQGILEVRYGAGTVMITLAATDPGQSEILWRHISNPDLVADAIRDLVKKQEAA